MDKIVRNGSGYVQSSQRSGFVTFDNGVSLTWSQGSGW